MCKVAVGLMKMRGGPQGRCREETVGLGRGKQVGQGQELGQGEGEGGAPQQEAGEGASVELAL